jgi:hypothetical protein
LLVLVDDTLARKGGKGISLATMHRDSLLHANRMPAIPPAGFSRKGIREVLSKSTTCSEPALSLRRDDR